MKILIRRSWEILTFAPRIVVFIRICGTHNTANEVFHCVHFECPCRPDILESYLNDHPSSSSSTSDDHVPDSVTFEDYYKSLQPLFDINTNNSSSTMENGSLTQTHTILPFAIKSTSAAIYTPEKESEERYL